MSKQTAQDLKNWIEETHRVLSSNLPLPEQYGAAYRKVIEALEKEQGQFMMFESTQGNLR